ncbi:MAG: hypothetical protein R3F61_06560 [Myxococcota bacterium]
MHPALKVAWSVFLVGHLTMMCLSVLGSIDIAKDASKLTDPYQWTFGLHQNWPMFAPNPRLETAWLEMEGKLASDGSYVPLVLPHGMPDPHGSIVLYDRSGKLERNAITRKHLRAAFVRWFCAKTEPELQAVRIWRIRQPTPKPGTPGPRESWPVHRDELEEWRCRGH